MSAVSRASKWGGIIIRYDQKEPHVLLILEPDGSYSFPKGKPKPKETLLMTAIRETHEESGLRNLEHSRELGVHTLNKQKIHLYLFEITHTPTHAVPHEAIRWMSIPDAKKKLDESHQRVLDLALSKKAL